MALTTTLRTQGAAYTPTVLFDTLDDLLVAGSQAAPAPSVASIATSTPTEISGATATVTVESGQVVLLGWHISYSIGSTDSFYIGLYENGVQVTNGYHQLTVSTNRTSASGLEDLFGGVHLITAPATGSVTYNLRAWRVGGAGTFYTNTRKFTALVIRNS